MNEQIVASSPHGDIPELSYIEKMTRLMDTRFRIPFTPYTFGIDPIIGLLPVVGDAISFAISSLLVLSMMRHGVSSGVVIRMIGNILLDLIVGTIPIAGSIFDFIYKANRRNYRLLKKHYKEGKYGENSLQVLLTFILVLVIVLGLFIYASISVIEWLLGSI